MPCFVPVLKMTQLKGKQIPLNLTAVNAARYAVTNSPTHLLSILMLDAKSVAYVGE